MPKHSYLALASASIFALATSGTFAQTADEAIDEVVVLSSPFKKSPDEIISQTHVITNNKIDKNKKKIDRSLEVAQTLAKKALEKKITKVYFDRGRYKYHGRIKSFAEALRKGGLAF